MPRPVLKVGAVGLAFLLLILSHTAAYTQTLFINEIQVANVDQYIDPSYNYGGWIELYNPGTTAVSLSGYSIRNTDAEGKVKTSTLTSAHGSVPARGYKVIWFDHNSKSGYYGSSAGAQIPFKLDADGGLLEIINTKTETMDAVDYPPCIARSSWMRVQDGNHEFGWTAKPTPKASNNNSKCVTDRLQAPHTSSNGGVFRERYEFSVEIPEGCTLYYTTDGSTPAVGKSEMSMDGIFSGDTTIIYRMMLSRQDCLHSPVITRSFFRTDGELSLPILSVSTAPANLFDNTIGLYVKGTNGRIANNSKVKANQNMDWERPVNMEYFVPDVNTEYSLALNQEVSFNIFGGWTRFNPGNENFEYRSSFKLKSGKVFEGKNSLDFPVFPSKPHIKLNNLLVRNGGQDKIARIWDAALQELVRTSGVYIDCQAWQPAHVYLDGRYLGMMNLREESNKEFAFSNYGIDKDEIDQWENDIIIKYGNMVKLNEWYDLSVKLASDPTNSDIWQQICDIVDIDEYCNYMAAEIYMGNSDWLRGALKNIKGFRAKDGQGKFHIVMHDVDGGFGQTDMMKKIMNGGTGTLSIRFKNMLRYEPFKKQFIDAYCLMAGSVFEPSRCIPIITEMKEIINPALALEGFSADSSANKMIHNISDYEEMRPQLKQSLVSTFSLSDEYDVKLHASIPEATLLFNGQEIPSGRFDGYLFPPITLTSSAPAGFRFCGWTVNGESITTDTLHLSEFFKPDSFHIQALYEQVETSMAPVRINEVSAGNDIYINEYGKKTDWLELYNNSDEDYDLAGAYLTDNPNKPYKFQIEASERYSTVIPAHGYKVIWCDGKESKTQLHAPFKLENADEAFVSITAAGEEWTDSLRYKAQPRWFTYGRYPDGGSSLALFERPTIENANRLCTSTELTHEVITAITSPLEDETDREIVAVRYYNLNGQQLSGTGRERIVIQHIIYRDGTRRSRKLFVGGK